MNKLVSGLAALKCSFWNILWYSLGLVEISADCVKCLADEVKIEIYYSIDFLLLTYVFLGFSCYIFCNVVKQAASKKWKDYCTEIREPGLSVDSPFVDSVVPGNIPYFPISSFKNEENTCFQIYHDCCILKWGVLEPQFEL